jgi:hypothetical protein
MFLGVTSQRAPLPSPQISAKSAQVGSPFGIQSSLTKLSITETELISPASNESEAAAASSSQPSAGCAGA